jgi:diacylglycerol kinase family enzyme
MASAESKRLFGVFAFAMTAVRVATRMTPFRVWIEYDGQLHRGRSWQVTVCNGRNYGNGLTIAENATLNDQRLHGLSTEVNKWWHGFGLIPSLLAGTFKENQHVTTFEGKEVKIATRRSKHVDVDGDIKTRTPLHIAVLPRAMRIFVP